MIRVVAGLLGAFLGWSQPVCQGRGDPALDDSRHSAADGSETLLPASSRPESYRGPLPPPSDRPEEPSGEAACGLPGAGEIRGTRSG